MICFNAATGRQSFVICSTKKLWVMNNDSSCEMRREKCQKMETWEEVKHFWFKKNWFSIKETRSLSRSSFIFKSFKSKKRARKKEMEMEVVREWISQKMIEKRNFKFYLRRRNFSIQLTKFFFEINRMNFWTFLSFKLNTSQRRLTSHDVMCYVLFKKCEMKSFFFETNERKSR